MICIRLFQWGIFVALSFVGCKSEPQNQDQKSIEKGIERIDVTEHYVSDSYHKRHDGFDWVAVSVKHHGDESLWVSVRSRADQKKPTCTYDTKAFRIDKNTYESTYDGKRIRFEFFPTSLTISTENPDDSNMLYFFCNGGATLAGHYGKIDGELDTQQIDLTTFSKVLNLQGIGFNVSSIEKDNKNTLTIFTFGLENRDYNETFTIEGQVVIDAEVEDLNSDGSPELFVYTQSVGSGSYGNIFAFSVNAKKSMSQVYFPPTSENPKINSGYRGHDAFTIVENTLSQRFPIYKEGDTNASPTGGTRQVSYTLVEGEAMRQLKVLDITEY
ncbi:PliI family lysozyme inhibitor of I-type lysozyme [Aestuariivivens sediminis]|uniref:PliI family lysozyme inhibitor of I-type lysozyme n=1 Tax=Aestuariivivens sediminis TaxID=2913557 RepID=UPI001F581638|nr:PliI family lysozyme inhibitor of I-type lysozyme [Aestuariivivens sediminis]